MGVQLSLRAATDSGPSLPVVPHDPITHSVPLSVCPFARGNCQPLNPLCCGGGQVTRGQTVLEDDWSSTTTSGPTYCPWLLSRRGTDCKETRTEGAEAAKLRSRREEEPRERSWMRSPGSRLPEAKQSTENRVPQPFVPLIPSAIFQSL